MLPFIDTCKMFSITMCAPNDSIVYNGYTQHVPTVINIVLLTMQLLYTAPLAVITITSLVAGAN